MGVIQPSRCQCSTALVGIFHFSLPSCAPVSHSSAGVMSRRCAVSREWEELLQQLEGAAHPSPFLEHTANLLLAT